MPAALSRNSILFINYIACSCQRKNAFTQVVRSVLVVKLAYVNAA